MTSNLTPVQAFDQLRQRVARGLVANGFLLSGDCQGRSERFQYDGSVADQSAAFPNRRISVKAILRVVATNDERLALQLSLSWRSIFGLHGSVAEYVITKSGTEIAIVPLWHQVVPTPIIDDIDTHTGGVGANEYHRNVLAELGESGRPIARMLSMDGRVVEPSELVAIAEVVANSTPLL